MSETIERKAIEEKLQAARDMLAGLENSVRTLQQQTAALARQALQIQERIRCYEELLAGNAADAGPDGKGSGAEFPQD